MEMTIPSVVLITVLVLLGIGFYGLMGVFNLIKIIVALQILAKGAILALVLAGTVTRQVNLAQSMALTVIVADTIVVVVGLALAVQIRRRFGTLSIRAISTLRR